jgi:hypothetical protein
MTQIARQTERRNSSGHAVRSSRPAVQLYNGNIRLIEIAPVSPGLFSASVNGDLLILSSRQPFLDACRQLLESGADPNSWVVMRHAGSDTDALRSKIGIAAMLSVRDDHLGCPKFRRWKASEGDAAASPITSDGNSDLRITEAAR